MAICHPDDKGMIPPLRSRVANIVAGAIIDKWPRLYQLGTFR
jgi:hypothetical protein